MRATLRLTRHSSIEPDYDGLVYSFKALIDALQPPKGGKKPRIGASVIVDDKPSVIGVPDYKWEKAPRGQGHVTIEVWEVVGERDTCPACGQEIQ